jgi:hypothetical protein
VYFSCPVDVRRLLGPEARSAFGCTICTASASASWDELQEAPLGVLAERIQRAVAGVFASDWQARVAQLEALRRRHGLRATHSVHGRHPRRGMLVTNMSRLSLAGLDFGHGAPLDLQLLSEIDSMAAVLPASDGVNIDIFEPLSNVESLPLLAATELAARPRARALRS